MGYEPIPRGTSLGVCPLDDSRSGYAESQTVTTRWHPAFALPVFMTEAGRTTAYTYDERGNVLSRSLIAETGTGGANSAGSTQHIHLPTAAGPMPIATIINGQKYAVHSDHLNTPRKLTDDSGQPVWQWAYSAFGADKPTLAKYRFANLDTTPNPGMTSAPNIAFNLRYPGQYFDEESGLHYNYFRSYSPTSRYTQADPIGLDGGWNRFGYRH